MHQFFSPLRLAGFSGQPSRWVSHYLARWGKCLHEAFGDAQFVYSAHGNGQARAYDGAEVRWPDRTLPHISVSTCGLIWLLQRWAFASKTSGGLSADASRLAALLSLTRRLQVQMGSAFGLMWLLHGSACGLDHRRMEFPRLILRYRRVASWTCLRCGALCVTDEAMLLLSA
jgi:hypothetical protein